MICNVYIETSLNWNQRGNGVVAIAFQLDDMDARTTYGFVKNCSQSKAVLLGIAKALDYVSYKDIRLHLSCNAVGNALKNGWLESWETKLYQADNKGKVIKNAREWHSVFEKLSGRTIEIHLNEFNEYRSYLIAESKRRMKKHG